MRINLPQAVKYFFPNPSLELVFIEAIANSIDAESTVVDIQISIEKFSNPKTLKITITDNGKGFTNERFDKFSKLLEVQENSHKGIGRLVFLSYFEEIDISSIYEGKHRTFQYSNDFDEKSKVIETDIKGNETNLIFNQYYLSKIRSHESIKPIALKKKILEEFYPRFYLMKQENKELTISISLFVTDTDNNYDFTTDKQQINLNDIIELKSEPVDASLIALFETMDIRYSINPNITEKTIITALCIDGRTFKMDIVSDENIPFGYEIIFLLQSSFFEGKVSPSRQEITIDDVILKSVKKIFQAKVSEILKREIPSIVENNKRISESLTNTYPHLLGYFEQETIGIIRREDSIKKAQEKFFKAQREVLEANDLSNATYEKSIELSSRALTEYILYRQIIINKLKSIDKSNNETDIHNLIVPKGKALKKSDFMSDLYCNNAWLLDDKYMTYNSILSDKVLSTLIKEISDEEIGEKDNSEPDIALIFSNNPETTAKVDVVVVELKKRGLQLEENVKAIVQLQKRAIKLMRFYPNRIQRIWFYAIVEFNDEFMLWLENDRFTQLFSVDTMFYREAEIKLQRDSSEKCNIGIYVLSLDAFINDADVRNSTFLKIVKENFKNRIE